MADAVSMTVSMIGTAQIIVRRISACSIVLCAALAASSCTVSINASYGSSAERAYVADIARPMSNLTQASARADASCLGGSRPDPARCFKSTQVEINAARALQRTMERIPIPDRLVKANKDFLHGLSVFIRGLAKRNNGLASRSSSEYAAGSKIINIGLALQKNALAEYPPGIDIVR